MTLSNLITKVSYAGTGANTPLSVTFNFWDASDIVVTKRVTATGVETVLALTTHYTVTGGNGSTGTLTPVAGATDFPATVTWTIKRSLPLTQETDLVENDAFASGSVETSMDKSAARDQEIQEQLNRSLRFPVTDSPSLSAEIPSTVDRIGKLLGFDANGEPEVTTISSLSSSTPASAYIETLLDDLNATSARATLEIAEPGFLNVKHPDYGAVGDGVADDTAAIQAAINVGTYPVFMPPGTYRITAQLDLSVGETVGGGKLIGSGRELTTIIQDTDNTGILKLWGAFCRVSDMTLDYTTPQGILNTNANGIEFHGVSHSVTERIKFHSCNRGMYVPQIAVISGANWVFSSSFRDLYFQQYSNQAFDLTAFNGGISGNVMDNIYCVGRDDAGVKMVTNNSFTLGNWTGGVLNQINVEDTKPTEAMYFNTCDGLVLNGIHFEQVESMTSSGGLMHFAGGRHFVNAVSVTYCQISVAVLAVIRVSGGSGAKVHLTGLTEANNTLSGGPTWRLFFISGSETGIELYGDLLKWTDFTSLGFSSSVPEVIKRVDFSSRHLKLGDQNIISAAAAPVSGTWAKGDIVFNNAPAAAGTIGWVCTTAGTPGTWKTWGTIAA